MKHPNHYFLTPIAAAFFAVFLPCCADKEPEEKPTEKKEDVSKSRIVGRIASIPAGRKFVLIQSYGTWNVPTGSILTTHGPEGRAANLLATGEKLGQYAAADVKSGTLEVGDGVYTIGTQRQSPVTEPTEPETEESEVTQSPPASES
ncbi:MAG: hypothetical protein ABJQ29_06410 [Luteolibacter sp.]